MHNYDYVTFPMFRNVWIESICICIPFFLDDIMHNVPLLFYNKRQIIFKSGILAEVPTQVYNCCIYLNLFRSHLLKKKKVKWLRQINWEIITMTTAISRTFCIIYLPTTINLKRKTFANIQTDNFKIYLYMYIYTAGL